MSFEKPSRTTKQIIMTDLSLARKEQKEVLAALRNVHSEKFLSKIEHVPKEERLTALRAALDVGIAQAEAGQVVRGTPAELMTRIHKRHGNTRRTSSN